MKIKKTAAAAVAAVLLLTAFAGCGKKASPPAGTDPQTTSQVSSGKSFSADNDIGVISREDGSGTRGAFIELFGIEQKNEAGEKVDNTTLKAAVTNNTSVMMAAVAGDLYAIGYISLGSMNDTVKGVKIDGAAPSVENIKNGSYKVSRPFNIVTKGAVSENAQDFIDFILSAQGQKVIEDTGYIGQENAPEYKSSVSGGKVVVSGSSSVTPVMQKLKEAYIALNAGVTVEIQQSDSSTGIQNTIDGICDIGMASRELKDSEKEKGVDSTVIATDGIAVIVNNGSTIAELSKEQVMKIFTGEITSWAEVTG